MKRLLVLGAGTAGTMAINKLRPMLPESEWQITVVEPSDVHHYQPGYLFLPFGAYTPEETFEPTDRFIPEGVTRVRAEVDRVEAESNLVHLVGGETLPYDYLVIASGTSPRPDQTPGMDDPEVWRKSVHEFFTFEGAMALREKLATWEGGRLVVHITEMPIKCPVAPLEFTFLADAFFAEKGMRDQVDSWVRTGPNKPVDRRQIEDAFGQRELDHLARTKGIDRDQLEDYARRRGVSIEQAEKWLRPVLGYKT